MQYYELMDGNGVRICTIGSASDETLETELLLLATSIGGIGGVAQIEKKAAYWKIIHARRSGKVRYLTCKRINGPSGELSNEAREYADLLDEILVANTMEDLGKLIDRILGLLDKYHPKYEKLRR